MLHVRNIASNVKGSVEVQLGEKTLIVGPNGAGKSAIVNSVELLAGFASDVSGRAKVRLKSTLATLADGELTVNADLSDGRRMNYGVPGDVVFRFPVAEVKEAITGSAESARVWLLSRSTGTVTRKDVVTWFGEKEKERYERTSKCVDCVGSEVDLLLAVTKRLKTGIREDRRTITADRRVMERLSAGLGPELTEAQVGELSVQTTQSFELYQKALRQQGMRGVRESVGRLEQEAQAAIAEFSRLEGELEKRSQTTREPSSAEEASRGLVRTILATGDWLVEVGATECLICGEGDFSPGSARMERFRKDAHNFDMRWSEWEQTLQLQQKGCAALRQAEEKIKVVTQARAELSDIGDVIDADVASAEWRAHSQAEKEARDTARRWQEVRSFRDSLNQAEDRIRANETTLRDCEAAINRLVTAATKSFESDVQGFLPENAQFQLQLLDGDKSVCKFGLLQNGVLRTALSGAEWVSLSLALACASLGEVSSDTVVVFTPEERAFDPQTLREVMVALSDAPGQVLLTSPIKPFGRIPKGWTIIQRERA